MNEPTENGQTSTGQPAETATGSAPLAGKDTRSNKLTLSDRVRSLRLPNKAATERSTGRPWLPWALCVVFGITTLVLAAHTFGKSAGESPKAAPGSTPIQSQGPAPAVGEVVLESKGYIIAAHQIQVSPKVGGMVMKLNIEEGMRVKKGQVIAEIERVEYETDRDRIKGLLEAARQRHQELKVGYRPEEVKQAKAELDEAEALRKQMLQDYERNRNLNKQALAPKEYEASESAYRTADRRFELKKLAHKLMVDGPRQEKIEAARNDVEQLEADLARAQWRLDNCTVRAPVSGTILTKLAEEGNIVNQLALNLKGSICDMADLADLEVELKVQERDVAKVFKGQKCRVRSEAYPERVYNGVVSRLMPIADRSQAAIPVRVKLEVPAEEEGVYLKPEMGAVVSFQRK